MYSAPSSAPVGGFTTWPRRAEAWLDAKGKFAWILATILGFMVFWPVGLALLVYMIWSKRMFNRSCSHSRDGSSRHGMSRHFGSSGNAAFDAYKSEMLARLEDEQRAFEGFLQRLRDAKDKSEFDAFMEDRARAAAEGTHATPPSDPPSIEGRAGAY
jgi:hypothetical protein